MTRIARELMLTALVVVLVFAFSTQIRRGDQLPAPPSMVTFVAAPPPPDVTSSTVSFRARLSSLDTTVQELRVETHRGAFTDKLAQFVTALGAVPDAARGEVSAAEIDRLRELVDETVDAIERRIEAQLDDEDVRQHLAGTVYELRRRMEAVNVWFRHDARH